MDNKKGLPAQAGNGGLIGVIIIIIVLLAGAWYMWRSARVTPIEENGVETEVGDLDSASTTEASLNSQSNSDDVNSIDTDLKASSYDHI